jgi:hypothetical protein
MRSLLVAEVAVLICCTGVLRIIQGDRCSLLQGGHDLDFRCLIGSPTAAPHRSFAGKALAYPIMLARCSESSMSLAGGTL